MQSKSYHFPSFKVVHDLVSVIYCTTAFLSSHFLSFIQFLSCSLPYLPLWHFFSFIFFLLLNSAKNLLRPTQNPLLLTLSYTKFLPTFFFLSYFPINNSNFQPNILICNNIEGLGNCGQTETHQSPLLHHIYPLFSPRQVLEKSGTCVNAGGGPRDDLSEVGKRERQQH